MSPRASLRFAFLSLVLAGGIAPVAQADTVTVFAAASTRNALEEIAAAYEANTGDEVVMSFAGSSSLARQIEAGAPADIFLSANPGWMDELEDKSLIVPETRSDLLTNSIVLVAHDAQAPKVEIGAGLDLSAMLAGGHLSMAMVDSVPAGLYGKAALTSLGLWDIVEPQVAQAANVRAALAYVATGEAPLGIVYATDAVAEPGVAVVGTFPTDSHPPIVYPVALLAAAQGATAADFLTFLQGPEARAAFERQGFGVTGD